MKETAGTLLIIVLFGLAALWSVQHRKNTELNKKLRAAQDQIEQRDAELKHVEQSVDELRNQQTGLTSEIGTLQGQLRSAREVAVAPASPAGPPQGGPVRSDGRGMGGVLSQMMKNPEMKKVMVQQQRMATELIYGPLFQELNLSTEQTEQLRRMLFERQMQAAEKTALFMGDPAADRTEMVKSLSEAREQFESELKAFLGDGPYEHYRAYNETVSERMALNQFNAMTPLPEAHNRQLLEIMREEKLAMNAALPPEELGLDREVRNLQAVISDEGMEKMFQQQGQLNTRVLDRARRILAPEHLTAFEKFQANQINMQRLSYEMAKKMFGTGQGPTPAADAR